jgi:DNA-binding beta-propeller fold protein YncE
MVAALTVVLHFPVAGSEQTEGPGNRPAAIEAVYVGSIGGGPLKSHFSSPRGIAVDDAGRVFVADNYCRVQVFDANGGFLDMWGTAGEGPGQFRRPVAIAIDQAGLVYVADALNDRIQVFTREGVFVRAWGSKGSGPGQFRQPEGVAVDRHGQVFVADTFNYRVQVFTADGSFLRTWGSKGLGDGQFHPKSPGIDGNGPVGIVVVDDGNVYVTDPWNFRVQVFTSSGTFLRKWGHLRTPNGSWNTPGAIAAGLRGGQLNTPAGIAIEPSGNVLVVTAGWWSTFGAFAVHRFTAGGEFLQRWGTDGFGPGQFDSPAGVAVDRAGNVYVADTNNNRVQKFSSTGHFIRQWGSIGDGLFRGPTDVALDPLGNVYVVDARNRRVQKLSSTGAFLGKWGPPNRSPRGEGSFEYPGPIAVDRDGRVYVGDLGDEIQIFARDGTFITQWEGDRRRLRIGDSPRAIATDNQNHVYVVGSDGVGKFGADGTFLDSWRHRRHTSASDVAIDSRGTIYVAEVHEDGKWSRVRVLSPAGKELTTWPSVGGGNDRSTGFMRIAVDSVGRVFLVEMWNCRVEVFDASGAFMGRWGSCGFGDGQFDGAGGIAVDAAGKVYVADYSNNRVQVFQVREVPRSPPPVDFFGNISQFATPRR